MPVFHACADQSTTNAFADLLRGLDAALTIHSERSLASENFECFERETALRAVYSERWTPGPGQVAGPDKWNLLT
ncbi:MAG: hypothetical protein ACI9W2_001388 [Gammaproteobacteria bacterium]|jgi:hypothetical protein